MSARIIIGIIGVTLCLIGLVVIVGTIQHNAWTFFGGWLALVAGGCTLIFNYDKDTTP